MECQHTGCQEEATRTVQPVPYVDGVGRYCDKHAEAILGEVRPRAEYVVDCPNCGCEFGV